MQAVIIRPPDLNKLVDIFSTGSYQHIAKTCDEFALVRFFIIVSLFTDEFLERAFTYDPLNLLYST